MKDIIVITALTIITILMVVPASAHADSWQERMLFEPTASQLELEQQRQRVMIYQGLTDVQVARAMDEQFGRIEHMMFGGTVITDDLGEPKLDLETGEALTEDDGC